MKTTYDGELISAYTGEEHSFTGKTYPQVTQMVRRMQDGDALVINARSETAT